MHPFTFMIEAAPRGATGFFWVIFKSYREIQRSRQTFATKAEAEADAKRVMLLLIAQSPIRE